MKKKKRILSALAIAVVFFIGGISVWVAPKAGVLELYVKITISSICFLGGILYLSAGSWMTLLAREILSDTDKIELTTIIELYEKGERALVYTHLRGMISDFKKAPTKEYFNETVRLISACIDYFPQKDTELEHIQNEILDEYHLIEQRNQEIKEVS